MTGWIDHERMEPSSVLRPVNMQTIDALTFARRVYSQAQNTSANQLRSRTGWTLDCHFVSCRLKPEKSLHPSSLSRPVNTARTRLLRADADALHCTNVERGYTLR